MNLDDDAMPQDADAPQQPQTKSVVEQARAYAAQLRTPQAPQDAEPRYQKSDVDNLTQWTIRNDPKARTKAYQDVWDNGSAAVKDYVRNYKSAPKDVQLKDQQLFHDTLSAYNEVLKSKQLSQGVSKSGSGISGYLLGLGNIFNSTPELAAELDKKFGGSFDHPLTQVDPEGNEIQGSFGLSRGQAILTAEQEIRAMEKLGIKGVMDPATAAVIKSLSFDLQLSGLTRTVAEFAAVKKVAGMTAGGLRGMAANLSEGGSPGMAGLARGAAVPFEFAAGQKFQAATGEGAAAGAGQVVEGGAIRSHMGPFTAHGFASGYIEGLSNYDDIVAKKISEGLELQVDDKGNIRDPAEVEKELKSVWNRQAHALGTGAEGAKHGALAGLSFMLAGRATSLAGRMIVPGPVKAMETSVNKAFETTSPGYRAFMRNIVQENGLGRFAASVVHGTTEFAGGSMVLDHMSNLVLGTPAPKWKSDDLLTSIAVGAIFSGAMGAWSGVKGRGKESLVEAGKKEADPLARIARARKGMPKNAQVALDETLERNNIPPKVLAEVLERSKDHGHDSAEAADAFTDLVGFSVAKKKGTIFTGEGAQPQGQEVLALPAKTGGEAIAPEPEYQPQQPGTAPADVEGGLQSVRKALDRGQAADDTELADGLRRVRDLLRRPGLSDTETAALERAVTSIEGRLSPQARQDALEGRHARETVEDYEADLKELDKRIDLQEAATNTVSPKLIRQRKDLLAKIEATKKGEGDPNYRPRARPKRASAGIPAEPGAPEVEAKPLTPEETATIERMLGGEPVDEAQARARRVQPLREEWEALRNELRQHEAPEAAERATTAPRPTDESGVGAERRQEFLRFRRKNPDLTEGEATAQFARQQESLEAYRREGERQAAERESKAGGAERGAARAQRRRAAQAVRERMAELERQITAEMMGTGGPRGLERGTGAVEMGAGPPSEGMSPGEQRAAQEAEARRQRAAGPQGEGPRALPAGGGVIQVEGRPGEPRLSAEERADAKGAYRRSLLGEIRDRFRGKGKKGRKPPEEPPAERATTAPEPKPPEPEPVRRPTSPPKSEGEKGQVRPSSATPEPEAEKPAAERATEAPKKETRAEYEARLTKEREANAARVEKELAEKKPMSPKEDVDSAYADLEQAKEEGDPEAIKEARADLKEANARAIQAGVEPKFEPVGKVSEAERQASRDRMAELVRQGQGAPAKPAAGPSTELSQIRQDIQNLGPEPTKPSSEARRFGTRGRAAASAFEQSRYDAEVKAHAAWKRQYDKLKKREVELGNQEYYARQEAEKSAAERATTAPKAPREAYKVEMELAAADRLPDTTQEVTRANNEKRRALRAELDAIRAAAKPKAPEPTPAPAPTKTAETQAIEAELTQLEKEFHRLDKAVKKGDDDTPLSHIKRLGLKSQRERVRARHEALLKKLPPEPTTAEVEEKVQAGKEAESMADMDLAQSVMGQNLRDPTGAERRTEMIASIGKYIAEYDAAQKKGDVKEAGRLRKLIEGIKENMLDLPGGAEAAVTALKEAADAKGLEMKAATENKGQPTKSAAEPKGNATAEQALNYVDELAKSGDFDEAQEFINTKMKVEDRPMAQKILDTKKAVALKKKQRDLQQPAPKKSRKPKAS